MGTPAEVLNFWFGDGGGYTCEDHVRERWFKRSDATDDDIRSRFGADVAAARRGDLDSWNESLDGQVALIILLDQFTRNLHRDSGEAFAADARAQSQVRALVSSEAHREMPPFHRCFAYMPCMHAEDLDLQNLGVDLFARLADDTAGTDHHDRFVEFHRYAVAHKDIVERFGRFPHRNERLGRQSSPEELEFLQQPGSSFG